MTNPGCGAAIGRGACGAYWRVFCLASSCSACWPPRQVFAQQVGGGQQQKAAEFVRLYERWEQTQDTEEKIALGEQVLALEPALKDWPLQAPRERVKGELWFDLGYAYRDRIRGDRADNLEKAIAAYEAALDGVQRARPAARVGDDAEQPRHRLWEPHPRRSGRQPGEGDCRLRGGADGATREALPREWAETQNNLGIAYANRIRGDRADNLEKAIAAYEAALTVRTREALPREWAERRTISPSPMQTASAAIGPTTWRRPLPPTRRRSRCSRARPCRESGR